MKRQITERDITTVLEYGIIHGLIYDINQKNNAGVLGLLFIPSRDQKLVADLKREIRELVELRTGNAYELL